MSGHPINFARFHNKIIGALFYPDFYRYIIRQKYRVIIVFYLILFLLSYLGPTINATNLLGQENNVIVNFSDEVLTHFPILSVEDGSLTTENEIKQTITHQDFPYPIISIDSSQSITGARAGGGAAITFLQDSIVINKLCILDIFLKNLGLPHIGQESIHDSENNYFISYTKESYIIDRGFIRDIVKNYAYFPASFYFYLLLIFVAIALFTVAMRGIFYSIFIFSYAKNLKLNLSYTNVYKLTLAALIPSTCIAALNILFLWSSSLLANGTVASTLYLGTNIYFSVFAARSLIPKKKQ